MKKYVEDSTKGSSRLEPKTEKSDVLVQVWVSSKVLAALCKWLDRRGVYSRFLSQVVRTPLEELVSKLVEIGETEVDNSIESRRLLESRFGINLNRGGRGRKNLLHNVVLDSRKGEERGSIDWNKIAYSPEVEKKLDDSRSEKQVVKESMSDEEVRAKMREIEESDKREEQAMREYLGGLQDR